MSDYLKSSIIVGTLIGGAILFATALQIYFGPFQSCVRAMAEANTDASPSQRHIFCGRPNGQ